MLTKSLEKTRQYYLALIKTETFLKILDDFRVRWGFNNDNFTKPDYYELYHDAKKTFIVWEKKKVSGTFNTKQQPLWLLF